MLVIRRCHGEAVVIDDRSILTVLSIRPAAVQFRLATPEATTTFLLAIGESRPVAKGLSVSLVGARQRSARLDFVGRRDIPVDRLEVWTAVRLGLMESPRRSEAAA